MKLKHYGMIVGSDLRAGNLDIKPNAKEPPSNTLMKNKREARMNRQGAIKMRWHDSAFVVLDRKSITITITTK